MSLGPGRGTRPTSPIRRFSPGDASLKGMTAPLFLLDPERDDTPLASDELHTGWKLRLPQHVRRHAIRSMRLSQGCEIQLSDGQGLRLRATIKDVETGLVEVTAVGRENAPDVSLILVQALAKGGHDEDAIDMATQIGVDKVRPWQADRSIAKWKEGRTDRKWRQVLDAATEQSRRAMTPELLPVLTSKPLVRDCYEATGRGDLTVVLHQDATMDWEDVEQQAASLDTGRCVRVIIGPEGGIGMMEVQEMVEAGAVATALGGNILRASTAGPVALTLLARALGRWRC